MNAVVAIDGPAASGKSTVARLVARNLGYVYVNTGAMYRTFAWLAHSLGIDPADRPAVKGLIGTTRFETIVKEGEVWLFANGEPCEPHLRKPEVNASVSPISSVPELREYLVNRQRYLRLAHCLVMEGRDIGTVVIPDTRHKFFLDASSDVRNARRQEQGEADALNQRDSMDRARVSAPLIRAADAIFIDSSSLTPEQVVEFIMEQLEKQGLPWRG